MLSETENNLFNLFTNITIVVIFTNNVNYGLTVRCAYISTAVLCKIAQRLHA